MGREHTAMSSFAVIKTLGESRRNWKRQYVGVNALNYDEKTKPITVRIGLMKLLVFAQCSTFMCALHDKHLLRKHILLGDHQLISNMWLFWYNKAFIRFQTAIILHHTKLKEPLHSSRVLNYFSSMLWSLLPDWTPVPYSWTLPSSFISSSRHLSIVLATMIDYFSLGACHGRFV